MQLLLGDCLEVLRTLPDCSVDAVVTDPPYGLAFMGKRWDYDVPSVEVWAECLRVLKPGGHLLAFAGTRTQHRMAVRIEDAGFEIRDMIAWCYATGFPKSHNLEGDWQGWGTALKPALEPITMARKPLEGTVAANVLQHGTGALNIDGCRVGTDGGTTRSEQAPYAASGWRTGHEIVELNAGRWPANLIHDGSDEVVGLFPESQGMQRGRLRRGASTGTSIGGKGRYGEAAPQEVEAGYGDSGSAARFFKQCKGYTEVWPNLTPEPANTAGNSSSQQRRFAAFALSDAATWALPVGSCSSVSLAPSTSATANELKQLSESVITAIQSIAPRFWQESKPTRLTLTLSHASFAVTREQTGTTTITASHWKSDGSADPVTFFITGTNTEAGDPVSAPRAFYCAKASKADRGEGNNHPTVKPTELMRYLCRLVTPPSGVVLDPFMGSGTTGKAAMLEGFRFIGIERDPDYLRIAEQRIGAAKPPSS